HSLPSPQWFKVAPPAVMLDLDAWVDKLPADGKSYVGISVTARDAEGMPIADGEPIHAETSNGTLATPRQLSKGGTSYFYLYAPEIPGTATVKASYGETSGSLTIHFSDIDHAIVQGQVSDANSGRPLENVQLHVPPHLTTSTDAEGHFFIMTGRDLENLGEKVLHISKSGYYPDKREIYIKTNWSMVVRSELHPIADGAFASTVIVLDSQSDTPTTEKLIETLEELLKLAGAKVYNIHSPGRRISVEERIKTVNAIADSGYYLQINHGQWTKGQPALVAAHYRGNQGTETFLKEILKQFNKTLLETPIATVQDRTTPEIQQTNKMAMTLEIKSLNHPNASVVQEAYAIFFGAWTFLKGDEEIDAEKQRRFMAYLKEKQAYSSY
ncbi:MAG: hypothetical protein OXU27_14995, partial [Candidatus Poribacteria bacterium]|nr:hypothetical protein [Candidatus Poribacteria bacterium]